MVEVFKGNRSDEHDNNAPFHPKVSIGVQTTLSTSSKGREVYHARGKHTQIGAVVECSRCPFLPHTLLVATAILLVPCWGDNAFIQCTLLLLAVGGEACKVRYRTK